VSGAETLCALQGLSRAALKDLRLLQAIKKGGRSLLIWVCRAAF